MRPIQTLFTQDSNYFNHIEGLRAIAGLSMVWYHFVIMLQMLVPRSEYFTLLAQHPALGFALANEVCLDTFFMISGFVIAYSLLSDQNKNGKASFSKFFIKRIARVYPSYILLLLVSIPFNSLMVKNLWANLLQVNNYLDSSVQYLTWTWSLAVEFQFYLVFSVFLALQQRWRLQKILPHLTVAVVLLPFILATWNFLYSHHGYIDQTFYTSHTWYQDHLFTKLAARSGPITHGLITAYIVIFHKDRLVTWIQSRSVTTINLITVLLMTIAATMIITDSWWDASLNIKSWQSSILWSISLRNIFSASLAGIILLCVQPRGLISLLKNFLSAPLWRPFGQLTFNAYLIHPVVLTLYFGWHTISGTSVGIADIPSMAVISFTLVYSIAALIYCWVELPIMDIARKQLLRPKSSKPAKESYLDCFSNQSYD